MARTEIALPADHPAVFQNVTGAGTAATPAEREPYERLAYEIVTMEDGTLVMPIRLTDTAGTSARWYFYQRSPTGTSWASSGSYNPPQRLHHDLYAPAVWSQSKPYFPTDPYNQHRNSLVFLTTTQGTSGDHSTVRTLQLEYGQNPSAEFYPTVVSIDIDDVPVEPALVPDHPPRMHAPFQNPNTSEAATDPFPMFYTQLKERDGDRTTDLALYKAGRYGNVTSQAGVIHANLQSSYVRDDDVTPQYIYQGVTGDEGGWFIQSGTSRHFGLAAGPPEAGEAIPISQTLFAYAMVGYENHITQANTLTSNSFAIWIARYVWTATQQPGYADNAGNTILRLTDSVYTQSWQFFYIPPLLIEFAKVTNNLMAYDAVTISDDILVASVQAGGSQEKLAYAYFTDLDELIIRVVLIGTGGDVTTFRVANATQPGDTELTQIRLGYKPEGKQLIVIGAACATDNSNRPELWYRILNLQSRTWQTGDWVQVDTTDWGTDTPSSNLWLSKYVYGNCVYLAATRHSGTTPHGSDTVYIYDLEIPGAPTVHWDREATGSELYADSTQPVTLTFKATDPDQGDDIAGYRVGKTVGTSTYPFTSPQAGFSATAGAALYELPGSDINPAFIPWQTTGQTTRTSEYSGTVTTGDDWASGWQIDGEDAPQTFYIQVRDTLSTVSDWAAVTVIPADPPTVTIDSPTAGETIDLADIITVTWTSEGQEYWQIQVTTESDTDTVLYNIGPVESDHTDRSVFFIEELDGNDNYIITVTITSDKGIEASASVTVTIDLPELAAPTVTAVLHPDGHAIDLYTHTLQGYDYNDAPAPTTESVTVTVADLTAGDHTYKTDRLGPVVNRQQPNLTVEGWDNPTINKTTDWLVRSGSKNLYYPTSRGRTNDGFVIVTEGPSSGWYDTLLNEGQNAAIWDVSAGGTTLDPDGLPYLTRPTVFQDTAMTVPAVRIGDPVRAIKDLSGNGYHGYFSTYIAVPPTLRYQFEGPGGTASAARGVPNNVSALWSVESLSGMRVNNFLAENYNNIYLYAVGAWNPQEWISPIGFEYPHTGTEPATVNGRRRAYQLLHAYQSVIVQWRDLHSVGLFSETPSRGSPDFGSGFWPWAQARIGDNYNIFVPQPILVSYSLDKGGQYSLDEFTFKPNATPLNPILGTNSGNQRWNLHILGMRYLWSILRVNYQTIPGNTARFYKGVVASSGTDTAGFGGLSNRQRSHLNGIFSRAVTWDRQIKPVAHDYENQGYTTEYDDEI